MISNSVGGVKEGAGEAALDSGGCRLGGGGLSSYIYHHHAESQARRWRGRSRWRRWWRGSVGRCRRRWRRRRRLGWGWLPLDSTANQGKRWMGSSETSTEPTGEQIQKKSNSLIEWGNYRWYMKMQAWTSQSHDNAHMPKKMFQATSWSCYNGEQMSSKVVQRHLLCISCESFSRILAKFLVPFLS